MFRTGYILGWRSDLLWFLGLPFLAIGVALACYHWLPVVAWASIGLWITIPHHFATWLRTYGLAEDWQRWKGRLIAGPIVIGAATLLGLRFAPGTALVLVTLWDHQHSLMQQHGLARIYDFKAKTGAPSTGRFDLLLNWILFGNMLLTAPLFANLWIRELYAWNLPFSAEGLRLFQQLCWGTTATYLCIYIGHAVWSLRRGHALNPIKFVFIGASYFMWYFTAWHTDSFLVFGISHRIMHGVQYIVIVHAYLQRKTLPTSDAPTDNAPTALSKLMTMRSIPLFLIACAAYALLYQFVVMRPLEEFGFGITSFMSVYKAIPELGLDAISHEMGYDLFAAMVVQAAPMTHYYFDSFIWKVSDSKVQQGL
jgi:hypothetical protein